MIFQELSVARNCPAPLIMLDIIRGLLYNFSKNLKGWHFMGHSATDFQIEF